MKRLIFSALVLSAVTANAQVKDGMVGINTDEPRATMHIEPGVSESKGLIIPRITAAEMKAMTAGLGADHHSMMTYLKEQMPVADRTGKLVDVAEPGYYYYDNTTGVEKWKTFGGGEQDFKALPTSWTGLYNYLSKGAGIGGTSLGTGRGNIGIGREAFSSFTNSSDMVGNANIGMGEAVFQFPNNGTMSASNNIGIGSVLYSLLNGGSMTGGGNVGMGSSIYNLNKANAQFSGVQNTSIGNSIFNLTNGDLTGMYNIGMGNILYTMRSGDMSASKNIAMGNDIYILNKTTGAVFSGVQNTSIGEKIFNLMNGDLIGASNIGMGYSQYLLGSGNMAGNINIAIGRESYYVVNGDITNTARNNIALGNSIYRLSSSSTSTFSGSNNTGIGKDLFALQNGNLRGNYNIAIGIDSYKVVNGDMINTASSNIALGNYIYRLLNNSASVFSGKGNIGIGNNLYNLSSGNLTGQLNIGMGDGVFNLAGGDLSGYNNIGIGNNTMYGGTGGIGGTFNTALGAQSMRTAGGIAGNYNIALGSSAMDISGKITGRYNIAIGTSAMNNNIDISGNYNIGIGNNAMSKDLIKGNNNIQIGNVSVDTIVAGQLNKVVTIGNGIGNLTTANTYSNVILLGHDNPVSSPKVGVGTYKPQAKLHVEGNIKVGNENNTCNADTEGSIRYDKPSKKFQGCDGTSWVNLN